MGTQFGLFTRILMTLLCVLAIWSVISALVMFWKRRRPGTAGLVPARRCTTIEGPHHRGGPPRDRLPPVGSQRPGHPGDRPVRHSGRSATAQDVRSGVRLRIPSAVGALLLAAACGSAGGELAASGAWARPTPAGATNGVVYLSVTSDTDDEIIAVEVPPTVAERAELHMTTTDGGGAGHHGSGGGATISMGEVEGVPIGAGSTVDFEPGGNHVMLIDVAEPLDRGPEVHLAADHDVGSNDRNRRRGRRQSS